MMIDTKFTLVTRITRASAVCIATTSYSLSDGSAPSINHPKGDEK